MFERRYLAGIRGLSTFIGVTEEKQKALQTWLKLEPSINPTGVRNITVH
jgi:hypothetical protein